MTIQLTPNETRLVLALRAMLKQCTCKGSGSIIVGNGRIGGETLKPCPNCAEAWATIASTESSAPQPAAAGQHIVNGPALAAFAQMIANGGLDTEPDHAIIEAEAREALGNVAAKEELQTPHSDIRKLEARNFYNE